MNMNTNKLVEKLQDFFDLSTKKQIQKHGKLLKIIAKLEHKKDRLERELAEVSENNATGSHYHDLRRELSVIGKMLRKAKDMAVRISAKNA
jgi:hypothetical protein